MSPTDVWNILMTFIFKLVVPGAGGCAAAWGLHWLAGKLIRFVLK